MTSNEPVSSTEYTRDYYQTSCQGYEEFVTTRGGVLPPRLDIPFRFAQIEPGMRVLDIGCGRGEIVFHAANQGAWVWGVDYAAEAVHIAREVLGEKLDEETRERVKVGQCDAKVLPFPTDSLDRIFMLDVVEHLYPEELQTALSEARRVLKPGGRLVIHTAPNLWYYSFGYPLYRMLQRARGQKLPANPRDRSAFMHLHVNEQTPTKLKKMLDRCGFNSQLWLLPIQDYRYETNLFVRYGMQFLTRVYPFRWIFCNDIFALATKGSKKG